MSAAELLASRNEVILSLRAVDKRLGELFCFPHTHRAYAESLNLLDLRADLAADLVRLGGDPGVDPVDAWVCETAVR